jgi:hypothetical protein
MTVPLTADGATDVSCESVPVEPLPPPGETDPPHAAKSQGSPRSVTLVMRAAAKLMRFMRASRLGLTISLRSSR